jgi:ribonuclease P protein component
MLSKKYRLQKDKDFDLVFKKGKNLGSEFLFLKLRKNDLEISRFGFILSKKISKNATVRNKIKRRLREIIRKELGSIKSGFDIVIVVKPRIVGKDYLEIRVGVEELLRKAGLV